MYIFNKILYLLLGLLLYQNLPSLLLNTKIAPFLRVAAVPRPRGGATPTCTLPPRHAAAFLRRRHFNSGPAPKEPNPQAVTD